MMMMMMMVVVVVTKEEERSRRLWSENNIPGLLLSAKGHQWLDCLELHDHYLLIRKSFFVLFSNSMLLAYGVITKILLC